MPQASALCFMYTHSFIGNWNGRGPRFSEVFLPLFYQNRKHTSKCPALKVPQARQGKQMYITATKMILFMNWRMNLAFFSALGYVLLKLKLQNHRLLSLWNNSQACFPEHRVIESEFCTWISSFLGGEMHDQTCGAEWSGISTLMLTVWSFYYYKTNRICDWFHHIRHCIQITTKNTLENSTLTSHFWGETKWACVTHWVTHWVFTEDTSILLFRTV